MDKPTTITVPVHDIIPTRFKILTISNVHHKFNPSLQLALKILQHTLLKEDLIGSYVSILHVPRDKLKSYLLKDSLPPLLFEELDTRFPQWKGVCGSTERRGIILNSNLLKVVQNAVLRGKRAN